MEKDVFINRTTDIDFFKNDYKKFREQEKNSRLILLNAKSGFGKSALVNKAFENEENTHFIRVKNINDRKYSNYSGLFIKTLGEVFEKYANGNSDFLTFLEYLRRKYNEKIIINFFKSVSPNPISSVVNTAEEAIEYYYSEKSVYAVITSEHTEAQKEVRNYIESAISKIDNGKKIVLTIENIQNIDNESLEFIRRLCAKNFNLYVIGEYTEGDDYNISAYDIEESFRENKIKVLWRDLEKLSLEHLFELFKY